MKGGWCTGIPHQVTQTLVTPLPANLKHGKMLPFFSKNSCVCNRSCNRPFEFDPTSQWGNWETSQSLMVLGCSALLNLLPSYWNWLWFSSGVQKDFLSRELLRKVIKEHTWIKVHHNCRKAAQGPYRLIPWAVALARKQNSEKDLPWFSVLCYFKACSGFEKRNFLGNSSSKLFRCNDNVIQLDVIQFRYNDTDTLFTQI